MTTPDERTEGKREGLKLAEGFADKERKAAEKELAYAKETKNFNPLTIASTKVRKETAKRIAAAIRKATPK
jgi:hypothetical protein